jgi:hypothetical protein
MMEVEQRFGFRSVLYILNGTGGRFARSDHRSYSALIDGTPTGWEVGIHYNNDTFDSPKRFGAQFDEIQPLSGQLVISGRAPTFGSIRSFRRPLYRTAASSSTRVSDGPARTAIAPESPLPFARSTRLPAILFL